MKKFNSKLFIESFLSSIRDMRQDALSFYPTVGTGILVVIASIVTAWKLKELPAKVPLYYSLPRGEARLVTKEFLFLIPVLLVLAFLVNCTLQCLYYRKEVFLSRLIGWNSLLFSLLGTYTLIRIIVLIL